jgi:hypothetical protein
MSRLFVLLAILLSLAILALVARQRLLAQREQALERFLTAPATDGAAPPFDPASVADLPPPARRYLRHVIAPGTPLARSVRLEMRGRMRRSPDAAPMVLAIEQLLVPWRGFLWWARVEGGPLMIRVTDHYAPRGADTDADSGQGDPGSEPHGAVRVAALGGLLPMGSEEGPDVTRSSRHRLAAESVWLPATLLPAAGAQWTAVDDERATVSLSIDGEEIPITLRVDEQGQLREVTMMRHGNEGRADWGPTPYGFAVEDEATFAGYTIPSRLRGGWWFGSERYDEANASAFEVHDAQFR